MRVRTRKLIELPIDIVHPSILNFLFFYQKEVSSRLELMQKNESISETDDLYLLKCSYWRKMAHRHAEKLLNSKNPDPSSIAYKVTLDGMNTDMSYKNPFPIVDQIVINTDAPTKFLFRIPCVAEEDENSECFCTDHWASFELHLNPEKFKPSRLTAKCVFWYFPEEEILSIYSFTY